MKYSEFEETVQNDLGFKVVLNHEVAGHPTVEVFSHSIPVAYVSKERVNVGGLAITAVDVLNDSECDDLLMCCYQLTKTEIKDREEEKKYYIRLRGVDIDLSYLNSSDTEYYFDSEDESIFTKTKFTESDIENIENADLRNIIRFYCDWEEVAE